MRIRSGIFVERRYYNEKENSFIYPKANQRKLLAIHETEQRLKDLESLLTMEALANPDADKNALNSIVSGFRGRAKQSASQSANPQESAGKSDFFDAWERFLQVRKLAPKREAVYRTLARALHRYEMHRRATADKKYSLSLKTLSLADIYQFEEFFRNEHLYYERFPKIYLQYPADLRPQHVSHKPNERSQNTLTLHIKKIRAFVNWCVREGLMQSSIFDRYEGVKAEKYGTPWYLTLEERDRIADCDLSDRPALAAQRDIFVFQCLVGCRLSDLKKLTRDNIVDGVLAYVPAKTRDMRADTIRVPLNEKAKALVARYSEADRRLFPFISDQRYNDAIKEVLAIAEIDRRVLVLNPTTGREEMRPICEIASSHLARRTFIGNLYKRVKDPCIVGSMSGHVEGSRAFARYRSIDDDIKRGYVDLIN
ncbi:MAG: site-specific integrase [Bacteroidales bacterium]|nr:site-specific integrase [Bacteroidales bacterium]